MQKPIVDILLATYNGEKFLEVQLDSIFNQSYPHIHIIARDDGSKDGTVQILKKYQEKYPNQFTLLPNDGNLGVNRNFSCLLEQGKHDYFMFADQDDFWLPEKVAKTLAKMQASESKLGADKPILVHTDLKVVDHDLNLIDPSFWKYSKLFPKTASGLNRLLVQNNVTGCTVMINKSLRKMGLPIPKEAMMHDWWLALVAAAFGKVEHVNEPTMLYRQHLNNVCWASKFSVMKIIKNYIFNDPKKGAPVKLKNKNQSEVFLDRYAEVLTAQQKKMIGAYINFLKARNFKKFPLLFRYRFFKNGFLNNVVYIVPKFHTAIFGLFEKSKKA